MVADFSAWFFCFFFFFVCLLVCLFVVEQGRMACTGWDVLLRVRSCCCLLLVDFCAVSASCRRLPVAAPDAAVACSGTRSSRGADSSGAAGNPCRRRRRPTGVMTGGDPGEAYSGTSFILTSAAAACGVGGQHVGSSTLPGTAAGAHALRLTE